MKTYHIRIDGQVYHVKIDDIKTNPIRVTVDGETVEVWLENEPDSHTKPITAPPGEKPVKVVSEKTSNGNDRLVKAPIPGVITAVQVRQGQSVQSGDVLCSLEAMKMVNAIRATRSGTIGAVYVTLGQHVRHQEVLLEFTEQEN
jgi:glutaconyl-CoA/methylmalonyl-CoA decarboxylase subunit gamma